MATPEERTQRPGSSDLGLTLERVGAKIIRYGLVIILLWVGALKFTAYEAEGIQGLVANSPLMSWLYSVTSVRGASMIGAIEISAVGSIGAIIIFLLTLTFVFTTPGVWQPGYGFPFPSPMPGQPGEGYLAVRSSDLDGGRGFASVAQSGNRLHSN